MDYLAGNVQLVIAIFGLYFIKILSIHAIYSSYQ